jgi:hypothetical protein
MSEIQEILVSDMFPDREDMTPAKLGARLRRFFRRWRQQIEYQGTESRLLAGCTMGSLVGIDRIPEHYQGSLRRECARQARLAEVKMRRRGLRWCKGRGGFCLFLSPALLEQFISAAVYAENNNPAWLNVEGMEWA